MVQRTLQENRRRTKDKTTGDVVREWVSFSVTIPPDLVESMGWKKGTEITITIGADQGESVLILKGVKS